MIHPSEDRVDLILLETPVSKQILDADALIVGIRRHLSATDLVGNDRRPRAHLLVGTELHGRDAALSMTDEAVLVDDRRDVAVVGYLLGRQRLGDALSVYAKHSCKEQSGRNDASDGSSISDPEMLHIHVLLLRFPRN